MDAQALKIFQRTSIKSKEELLEAVDLYIADLEISTNDCLALPCHKPAIAELAIQFRQVLQCTDLAYLDRPFERYETTITNRGIYLASAEYKEIEFGANNEFAKTESSISPDILSVKTSYIPAKEFASRSGFNEKIIMSWIKQRKVKCAKKLTAGWAVAATQQIPPPNNEFGSYVFVGHTGDLSSILPIEKGTVCGSSPVCVGEELKK